MNTVDSYVGPAVIETSEGSSPAEVNYRVTQDKIAIDDVRTVDGMNSWRGVITECDARLLGAALDGATLVLPDGRRGRIILTVTAIDVTAFGDTWQSSLGSGIEFVGNGPAPTFADD